MIRMKRCNTCQVEKPLGEFHKNARSKDGRIGKCKPCQAEYHRNHYLENPKMYKDKARRREIKHRAELDVMIHEIKDHPCMDCGVKYPPYVMDFDHRDPTQKTENVSMMRVTGFNKQRVLEEIAKCDLVCANCHRVRTWKQQRKLP
jgi:hypothetical protein